MAEFLSAAELDSTALLTTLSADGTEHPDAASIRADGGSYGYNPISVESESESESGGSDEEADSQENTVAPRPVIYSCQAIFRLLCPGRKR